MNKPWSTKLFILILIVLLTPVFSYTIFQFAQRGSEEALIQSIYDRQLRTILFSVNQHCWDLFSSWTTRFSTIARNSGTLSRKDTEDALNEFLDIRMELSGVFLPQSERDPFLILKPEALGPESSRDDAEIRMRIQDIIDRNRSRIDKLVLRAREGYMQPLIIDWSAHPGRRITCHIIPLWNGAGSEASDPAVLFIDDERFVREIVARKFTEMDDGTLIFAVKDRLTGNFVFRTDEADEQMFEKRESLWVIPDLDLMIRLRGQTLDHLSRIRTERNLIFIVLVNVLLVAGLIYLFRNMAAEMALAQMKTDFVANVSHELRTPLALIRMHAETLEMGRITDENKMHHYYRTIMNESARLTRLINNILDFSRIESRSKKHTLCEQDLTAVISEALNGYRSHFDQKGFRLHVHLAENLSRVRIDSESVRLAFVNLLDNAIKFSGNKKEVRVDLKQEKNRLVLSVSDRGIGIPESEHKKIFDKFYRVGSSLVHDTRGSGLGLSLVQHIMEIHSGEIKVESKPGEGSRFSLFFPTVRPDTEG